MANPQKENGHTQIANELIEEILKAPLGIREFKIVLCIIRYTYGFHRKSAELSVRFISRATNIRFQHIAKTLNNLEKKNLISFIQNAKHKQGRLIQINKDYDSWKLNSSQKGDGIVPKEVTETVPKKVTKKENYKENIKHDQALMNNSSSKEKYKNWRHRKRKENEKVFIDKKEIQNHFSREVNQKDIDEINNIAEKFGIETMINLFNSLTDKIHSTKIFTDSDIEAKAKECIYLKNLNIEKQNQITKEDCNNKNFINLFNHLIIEPTKAEKKNEPVNLNLIKEVYSDGMDINKVVSKYSIT